MFPKCIKPLQKDCFKVCPRFGQVKATKTTRWRWQKDCVHSYRTCMWSIRWFVLTIIHSNNLPEKFAVLWFYSSSVWASNAVDFWIQYQPNNLQCSRSRGRHFSSDNFRHLEAKFFTPRPVDSSLLIYVIQRNFVHTQRTLLETLVKIPGFLKTWNTLGWITLMRKASYAKWPLFLWRIHKKTEMWFRTYTFYSSDKWHQLSKFL